MSSSLQVLGGLTLFLFGVRMLNSGLEKIAGSKIQEWLERMTTSRLKAALFGTGVTALMQSSSLMMATMIGLINANIMTLELALTKSGARSFCRWCCVTICNSRSSFSAGYETD